MVLTVVVILILVAVGSVAFHLLSPWVETPIASNWHSIDFAVDITFWITGVVYTFVILFMAYCVYRYRYRKERRSEYDPENSKLEWILTWGTAIGVVALLTPGLLAWKEFVTVPKEATDVEVIARQWEWNYRLPGADGILGTSNLNFVNDDNPFGINPNDPNGQDDVLIEGDALHLQLDKPVKILLRSMDVLHDFYVPQFRGKMDAIPGSITFFWMTPTRTGNFDVLCAELCGVGHHAMRGQVVIDGAEKYQEWLEEQSTFAELYPQAPRKIEQASASGAQTHEVDAAVRGAAQKPASR